MTMLIVMRCSAIEGFFSLVAQHHFFSKTRQNKIPIRYYGVINKCSLPSVKIAAGYFVLRHEVLFYEQLGSSFELRGQSTEKPCVVLTEHAGMKPHFAARCNDPVHIGSLNDKQCSRLPFGKLL